MPTDTPPQQLSPLRNLGVLHPSIPTSHSGYSSDEKSSTYTATLRSLPVQVHDTDDADHFEADNTQGISVDSSICDESSENSQEL